ncbi:MAG: winged helix-turn-helix domain-containing protein [Chloroflexi bacterium]|nr:winged helix-turn-helix domain-containing protein [Chloroflexota bacterium]
MMNPFNISKITARRFIMGKQGLWPGRRYQGVDGTSAALHKMDALQLDPLNVIARSQDIMMYGRVLDYRPADLYTVAYERREFFDYGGTLFLYPMSELPYWRLHMKRAREWKRLKTFREEHPETIKEVLAALRANGPMGNKDFKGNKKLINSYRGGKDTSVALYSLWITGEVMITRRDSFTRIYDLTERVSPPELNHSATEQEAEDFFARKSISFLGLMKEKRWRTVFSNYIQRKLDVKEADKRIAALHEQDLIVPISIEGSKDRWIALAQDLPLLEVLDSGKTPDAWQTLGPSTQDEITFVAPLEIVSARGRAKEVFDFEYIWEVYKPLSKRRWGYYVLPILYGDDLVARLDPKLDRKTMTLHIKGFWLEEDAPINDPAFADALGKGLARFAKFIEAKKVDIDAISPKKLRNHIQKFVGKM